jgi:CheY-like chemotaxis protein
MEEARPVLVVDDDPDIREALRLVLEAEGYRVVEAGDGVAGLRAAAAEDPRLVLLDVRMPQMDGPAFARAYRALFARPAPIVVMAASGPASHAREMGAQAFVAKPFDMDAVTKVVGRLVQEPARLGAPGTGRGAAKAWARALRVPEERGGTPPRAL